MKLKEIILFVILFVGFVFWQFYVSRFNYNQSQWIGKSPPNFTVKNLKTEETFDLSQFLGKKAILVSFWATWCETCLLEMDTFNSLVQSMDSSEIQLVSLLEDVTPTFKEAQEKLAAFEKKMPVAFDVYWDEHQLAADVFSTYKIPETFVINKEGVVVYKHEGALLKNDLDTVFKALNLMMEPKK